MRSHRHPLSVMKRTGTYRGVPCTVILGPQMVWCHTDWSEKMQLECFYIRFTMPGKTRAHQTWVRAHKVKDIKVVKENQLC